MYCQFPRLCKFINTRVKGYRRGNIAYCISAKGLINAKWITWVDAKGLIDHAMQAMLFNRHACAIGNGLSIGHRVVVFVWLSNWTQPIGVARPISLPAPRKNVFSVIQCVYCINGGMNVRDYCECTGA